MVIANVTGNNILTASGGQQKPETECNLMKVIFWNLEYDLNVSDRVSWQNPHIRYQPKAGRNSIIQLWLNYPIR